MADQDGIGTIVARGGSVATRTRMGRDSDDPEDGWREE